MQCQKSLWLSQKSPELRTQPSADALDRIQNGIEIGKLAQQLFAGGQEIKFDADNVAAMLSYTQQYLEQGQKTLYEAAFSSSGIFIMCDILHHGENGWQLYEVKASTSVKNHHRDDLAIQWFVLQKAGLKLHSANIIHINTHYVRRGELDIQKLFKVVDITEEVIHRHVGIPGNLLSLHDMLAHEKPDIPIGLHCRNPYECDYIAHCWKDVPEYSVFNLYNLQGDKKFKLYNSGIRTLNDLPENMPLNFVQKLQMRAHKQHVPIIDKLVLKQFIDRLDEPVCFLDFESFQQVVPYFDHQCPYEQIPFQYSLHIQIEDSLIHKEFLGDGKSDPRRLLAESLIRDIGKAGSIVAFNMTFEKSVINKLAEHLPDLATDLRAINPRFIDLVVPFRQGGYYDEKMKGSFSIKSILPALFPDAPELSYKTLAIQDGGNASQTYANLHQINDIHRLQAIRKDLLAYCRLDTLAMVRIVEFLKKIIQFQDVL